VTFNKITPGDCLVPRQRIVLGILNEIAARLDTEEDTEKVLQNEPSSDDQTDDEEPGAGRMTTTAAALSFSQVACPNVHMLESHVPLLLAVYKCSIPGANKVDNWLHHSSAPYYATTLVSGDRSTHLCVRTLPSERRQLLRGLFTQKRDVHGRMSNEYFVALILLKIIYSTQ
jgi:hypothetical protein